MSAENSDDYTSVKIIPAHLMAEWTAHTKLTHRHLPGLAAFINKIHGRFDLAELFVQELPERRVLTAGDPHPGTCPDQSGYRVRSATVEQFCDEFDVDEDLAEKYRPYIRAGRGAERSFGRADVADLPVPAAAFVRELDALFGRPPLDPSDYTPTQSFITTLIELAENTPPATDEPRTVLTLADPETGDEALVKLAQTHVEALNTAAYQLLQAAYETRPKTTGGQRTKTTDDDYQQAAQQDHESAVEELELQHAYERYDGPLGWHEWSSQQRARRWAE
ncbi:hypothetical protein GCM10009733_020180 [Nonomuraea maheshkhaliensis]|uniref:Uncharacterized protein n=2 Tax=Nonomuraea maheshkhaliensis TaxID=419590 RepID=A0ABN2EZN0_9ACTN